MVTDRMYSRERHTDLRQVKWVDRLLDRRAGTGTGIEAQTAIGWGGGKDFYEEIKDNDGSQLHPRGQDQLQIEREARLVSLPAVALGPGRAQRSR